MNDEDSYGVAMAVSHGRFGGFPASQIDLSAPHLHKQSLPISTTLPRSHHPMLET
jgi:hypothetical protein